MIKKNDVVEDAKVFLYNFIQSIDEYSIKEYVTILYDYIDQNKDSIYDSKINVSNLISSYIWYMYFYINYENMIDYDLFLQNYLSNYIKTKSSTLHRQKGINLL